jgi:dTDP-N-acetylfucosamine:lipid II N-acetylfucosaminyltransferase
MIYHLLHVSNYPEKYVKFLIRNKDSFNLDKHHFIIETNDKKLFSPDIMNEIRYSVTKKGWDVYRYIKFTKEDDKIIVHYLGNPRHLLMFGLFPHLLQRVVWSIWGGDAYFVNYLTESWLFYSYELLRKRIIPRVPLITCVVKGDYDFVVSRYNSTARYLKSIYPSDLNDESFVALCAREINKTSKSVLIGNSADAANNHCEVITALGKYRDEIDEILVPLSYGGSQEYILRVISLGRDYFGSKFKPLTELMPSAAYSAVLNSAKVQVFNHYHQEGLGNAVSMLALKKRIFIRGDISSFAYFKDLGIQVYDTRDLLLDDALLFDDNQLIAEENSKIMLQETSEAHLVELWTKVFNETLQ